MFMLEDIQGGKEGKVVMLNFMKGIALVCLFLIREWGVKGSNMKLEGVEHEGRDRVYVT